MPRFFAILLLLLSCSVGRAMILRGPDPSLGTSTVEALTAQCPFILTATIVSHASAGLTFNPIDVLKVPPGFAPAPAMTFAPGYSVGPIRAWPAPGDRVLIFIGGFDASYPPPLWEVRDFVPLDPSAPAHAGHTDAIRDLTLQPIATPSAVLAAVQSELHRNPPTTSVKKFFVYPFDLNTVPDDARLLPAARGWIKSSDPLARYLGVRVLAEAADPQDVPALKAALADPFTVDYPWFLSPWTAHEYAIRQAAALSLDSRRITYPPIAFTSPNPGIYSPVPLRQITIWLFAPFPLFWLARFTWRSLLRKPRSRIRQWLLASLGFTCLYAATLCAALWHRSLSKVDNFVVAQNGHAADLLSFHGLIEVELARNWPFSTTPVTLSLFPLGSRTPVPDTGIQTLTTRLSNQGLLDYFFYGVPFRLGAHAQAIHEAFSPELGRRQDIKVSGIKLATTYPTLILALLAFPALRASWPVFKSAKRRLRARKLARQGLCQKCHYDLRAHLPGSRCPECGTAVPTPPATPKPAAPEPPPHGMAAAPPDFTIRK